VQSYTSTSAIFVLVVGWCGSNASYVSRSYSARWINRSQLLKVEFGNCFRLLGSLDSSKWAGRRRVRQGTRLVVHPRGAQPGAGPVKPLLLSDLPRACAKLVAAP
jgi:hypothetical protein